MWEHTDCSVCAACLYEVLGQTAGVIVALHDVTAKFCACLFTAEILTPLMKPAPTGWCQQMDTKNKRNMTACCTLDCLSLFLHCSYHFISFSIQSNILLHHVKNPTSLKVKSLECSNKPSTTVLAVLSVPTPHSTSGWWDKVKLISDSPPDTNDWQQAESHLGLWRGTF